MAYDEKLASRMREILADVTSVEEKKMMGGLAFMVNKKMCVCVVKNDLMARVGPDAYEEALKKKGCRKMDFTGRPLKGYVFVSPKVLGTKKELRAWIDLALAFNKK